MSTFILIVNKTDDIRGGSIAASKIAENRMQAGKWGLYANTPHKKEIKSGDQLLIYLAGIGGKKFIAQAKAGNIIGARDYDADGPYALTASPVSVLNITDVKPLKAPVPIHQIKDELDFVPKGTSKWGCVMQRGVKRISNEDAEKILSWRSAS